MNYEQLREQFKHNITFYCYDHTLTPDRDETIDYYCKQYEMEIFELKKQLDEANEEITRLKALIPERKNWCCEAASNSNGWRHDGTCENWVLPL